MLWDYEFHEDALPSLRRIGPSNQGKVRAYLDKRIKGASNPRQFGKPLVRNLKGLWRYRVEDIRIICRLEDHRCIVMVIEVGHRSAIYED